MFSTFGWLFSLHRNINTDNVFFGDEHSGEKTPLFPLCILINTNFSWMIFTQNVNWVSLFRENSLALVFTLSLTRMLVCFSYPRRTRGKCFPQNGVSRDTFFLSSMFFSSFSRKKFSEFFSDRNYEIFLTGIGSFVMKFRTYAFFYCLNLSNR